MKNDDARVTAALDAYALCLARQRGPALDRNYRQAMSLALAAADRVGLVRCYTCHEMKLSLAAAEAHTAADSGGSTREP